MEMLTCLSDWVCVHVNAPWGTKGFLMTETASARVCINYTNTGRVPIRTRWLIRSFHLSRWSVLLIEMYLYCCKLKFKVRLPLNTYFPEQLGISFTNMYSNRDVLVPVFLKLGMSTSVWVQYGVQIPSSDWVRTKHYTMTLKPHF